ncbi:MAG: putative phage tail protein [Roseivirga sp.]|jgi:predicted phage tail protein
MLLIAKIEITTTESADSQTQWESVGVTSKSTFVVEDLTPGTYYWFRIRAFGRRYESPYSNPALIMVA